MGRTPPPYFTPLLPLVPGRSHPIAGPGAAGSRGRGRGRGRRALAAAAAEGEAWGGRGRARGARPAEGRAG